MRVLFNTHPLRFQHPGGGEVVLKRLYNGLKEQNIDVELFEPWAHKLKDFDIIHEFHCLQWQLWPDYKKECRKLIVTPTHWPDTSLSKRIKFNLKENIRIAQGVMETQKKSMLCPDLFLPTTKLEMDRIEKFYGLKLSYEVLSNGVSLPHPPKDPDFYKNHYQISEYCLFVGNISTVKNVHTLIDIFNESGENLIIVGGYREEDRGYYESCVQKAKKNIFFTGHLKNDSDELNNIYHGARLLVAPSYFETCSLVGLEAAVRGLPVVMTREGGTREVYQDYVNYCDPTKKESISTAICDAKKNQDHTSLKKFVSENYTWDQIVKKLIKIYAQSLDQE